MSWLAFTLVAVLVAVAVVFAHHGATIVIDHNDPAGVAWCIGAVIIAATAVGLVLAETL